MGPEKALELSLEGHQEFQEAKKDKEGVHFKQYKGTETKDRAQSDGSVSRPVWLDCRG